MQLNIIRTWNWLQYLHVVILQTVKILTDTATVYHVDEAEKMKDKIDVMILCGGSATDLPVQTPKYAQWFNVVDSFDTHARVSGAFCKC